jgi:hypothetical protein
MLDGRFILGISPGGLLSDAEAYGNLDADRNAMFVEVSMSTRPCSTSTAWRRSSSASSASGLPYGCGSTT